MISVRLLTILTFWLAISVGSMTAFAQRSVSFDSYAIPAVGALAITVRTGMPGDGVYGELDAQLDGALGRAAASAGFQAQRGEVLNLRGVGVYEQIVLVGIGEEALSERLLEDIGGLVGQAGRASASNRIDLLWADSTLASAGAHLALGLELGQYRFTRYRNIDPAKPVLGKGEIVIRVADPSAARTAWTSQWQPVAEGVGLARDLVSEPANTLYPQSFVERSRKAFDGIAGVSIEVVDEAAMARLEMGSILAVGQGSARPPRLMLIRYQGGPPDQAPIALVGKGITFDTGGISIKDKQNLWRMKYDMSGAAAVTGAALTLARRKAEVNLVAVAALAENMPSASASRPGDVVRTMSGKTYEIVSTDAEGRMVLADAVWYVQQFDQPRLLIDVATLTGSQVTALGDEYAGLFSRDDALATEVIAAGVASGEEAWRLPLHPSYAKDLESPIADLRNGGSSRKAGAGVGAHFIGNWIAPELPWVHLDIASMAWRDDPPLPTVPPGATGYGVRLLDRFVRLHQGQR